MKIRRLEELEAWKEAKILCKGTYIITEKFPEHEKYNLTKHIRENGRAIPSNVAEGFGRYFFKDNLKFYGIAKGCLSELKSDIYISYDNKYLDKETLSKFIKQIDRVEAKVNGLIGNIIRKIK